MLAQAIKRRLSKEENQKGFTLIELLAVIVILGIIAVIAIPMIGNIINKSKSDSDVAAARQIYDATRMYVMGELQGDFKNKVVNINDVDSDNKNDLVHAGYLDNPVYLPSTKEEIAGGTVTFSGDGVLSEIKIITTTHTSTKPLTFSGTEVMKSEK